MQASLVRIKVKERLNKRDSSDYDNIECWQVREAFNKAQLDWVRRQVHGKNDTQEGDEETRQRVDDLQILLKSAKLDVKDHFIFAESKKLPANYLYLKRITPAVSKGDCKYKLIKSTLREEANVDEYLQDWSLQPSFEFEETFHTLIDNKVRLYTNKDFEVLGLNIIYYRYPREIDFAGCQHLDSSIGVEIDPEFKDDIVELLIDDTVSILAGDIESPNQLQLTKQRNEVNN